MPDLTVSSNVDSLLSAADYAAMRTLLGIREVLTVNRTYFVRPGGNNSNTGLIDDNSGAFATWAKAFDVLATLDGAGFVATVKGTGTFTENVVVDKAFVGFSKIILEGDVTTPANCTIDPSSGVILTVNCLTAIDIRGIRFGEGTAAASGGISILRGTVSQTGACIYGAVTGTQIGASGPFCQFNMDSSYTINGGGQAHVAFYDDAFFNGNGTARTVTVSGSPNFSASFYIFGRRAGGLLVSITFSGSITGTAQRYDVQALSQLFTSAITGSIPGTGQTVNALGNFT
jgi:hypothetical protein